MWYVEIKRSQSLRQRSKELREQAQKICAQSREIVGRSANFQKNVEPSGGRSHRIVQSFPSK